MPTLFLPWLDSRKHKADFRSSWAVKMVESSLAGTVLSGRFKILKTIDVDSYKAHDLLLDQTVTVRQAIPASQRADDTWRQKVQHLASVRDPNFLNILDVIYDKSSYFVVSECHLGKSIAELLRERSRFDPEGALALMTPLAGALDLAASFVCYPNLISARWLFAETRRSFAVNSEEPLLLQLLPFFVKLDVWELVRPRKNIEWPFLSLNALSSDSRSLAVRQTALLTYELLGGEKKEKGEVKRWFKPVNELGEAGNSILYRGLQGSPRFETSEDFVHKLESAIRSGAGASRALPAPALRTREHSMALPETNNVIRLFDRDTKRLATQVMGAMVFAALVLALLVQERYPKAVDFTEGPRQARGDLLLNATSLSKGVGFNEKSTGKTTSGQATGVDHGFTVISPQENPSPRMETAASAQTPVDALIPEIKHPDRQSNTTSWSPAHWEDSGRIIGLKVPRPRSRSSGRPRFVDVKMRLIALWHESWARSEKSRTWTAFSNSNKGERRKVGYTAETYH